MYIVAIQNGTNTYEIHNEKIKLLSGQVVKGINTIDSFSFSALPNNPAFNNLNDFKTLVTVYNTTKRKYEFYGRVLCSTMGMSDNGLLTQEAVCESYFGFLCDSVQTYVIEMNWTVKSLFTHIISTHNRLVEAHKQFKVGEITVTDPNDNVYIGIQRENTWETITKKLIEKLGGEIRFRVEDDGIYIDYLKRIGEEKNTVIALSRNMKSITKEKDPSSFITRLIPLGAKLNDNSEARLTITDVNNGLNYIDDTEAVEKYGIHIGYVEFDDITTADRLLAAGETWLKENNKVLIKYSITALDLSLIGLDIDDFEVYNSYPIENALLGISDTARVIKQTIDVCDETKKSFEIGDNFKTLSELQREQMASLGKINADVAVIIRDYATNQKLTDAITKTESLIQQQEEAILLKVSAGYTSAEDLSVYAELVAAELALKVGKDENDQIVSMLNASADTIILNSNRLVINSDHFQLTADGTVSIKNGEWELQTVTDMGYGYNRTVTLSVNTNGLSLETYEDLTYAEGDYGDTREVHNFQIGESGKLEFFFERAVTYAYYSLNADIGIDFHTSDDLFGNDKAVFAVNSNAIQLGKTSNTTGALRGLWNCEPIVPNGTLTDVNGRTYELERTDSRIITLWDLYNLGIITEAKYREIWDDDNGIR